MAGEDDIRDAVDAAAEPLEGEEIRCPVIALGQRNRIYYFIAVSGEVHELSTRDFNPVGILSLFNGDPTWLLDAAPRRDREGAVVGFHAQKAAALLIKKCADVGLWNPDTPLRSVGVWRGDAAALVVHAGDAVLSTADPVPRWVPSGRHIGRAIYTAAPPIERHAPLPADKSAARDLRAAFDLWNYAHSSSSKLAFGWMASAMLGSAPDWRSNILITGERGSGKSALTRLARRALGAQARSLNNFSEAGLRQLLTRESLALVLDEAEGNGAGDRLNAVIELIRQMTGDEGVQGTRGSAAGVAHSFTLASPTWLSAINPPALLPQDRSRIFEIELRKPDATQKPAIDAAIAAATQQSAALRARAIFGWSRFCDNFTAYRRALVAKGCDARQADQLGTMLAAAEMMLSDETAMSDTVEEDITELLPLVTSLVLEDDDESDPLQCWSVLMTRQVEHWLGGSKSTIGRLIHSGLAETEYGARNALRVYGLRLDMPFERAADAPNRDEPPRLLVANQHEGLKQIFRDTRWRDGGWRRSLLRLEGTMKAPEPVQFDGYKSRCIIVPARYLPHPPPPVPPGGDPLA